MKGFPHHEFTLQTNAGLTLVYRRLSKQVEPAKPVRKVSHDHAPYEGVVSENSFKIRRVYHYRSQFWPTIRGRLKEQDGRTHINVTMSLHPSVPLLVGLWFLGWYGLTIPVAIANIIPTPIAILFLAVPVLSLLGSWWTFWKEVNRSQRDLEAILQGNNDNAIHPKPSTDNPID